jgi:hypothetical protein
MPLGEPWTAPTMRSAPAPFVSLRAAQTDSLCPWSGRGASMTKRACAREAVKKREQG